MSLITTLEKAYPVRELLFKYLTATESSLLLQITNIEIEESERQRYTKVLRDLGSYQIEIGEFINEGYTVLLVGKDTKVLCDRIHNPVEYYRKYGTSWHLYIWLAILRKDNTRYRPEDLVKYWYNDMSASEFIESTTGLEENIHYIYSPYEDCIVTLKDKSKLDKNLLPLSCGGHGNVFMHTTKDRDYVRQTSNWMSGYTDINSDISLMEFHNTSQTTPGMAFLPKIVSPLLLDSKDAPLSYISLGKEEGKPVTIYGEYNSEPMQCMYYCSDINYIVLMTDDNLKVEEYNTQGCVTKLFYEPHLYKIPYK